VHVLRNCGSDTAVEMFFVRLLISEYNRLTKFMHQKQLIQGYVQLLGEGEC